MKNNKNSKSEKSFTGKGIFPYKFAFTLLIPLRNIFLSPKKLIERLELKEDFIVLEIGPGPGYFSIKVAQRLTQGKLVLADIQQEMLDYAKKRIEKRGLKNVEYKLCDGEKLKFSNEYFDRVFMVTVIGEVVQKEKYIHEINRILKKGGLLSISELAGDPDRMNIEELKELTAIGGLKLQKHFGSKKNYTINFIKE
jgi:ubiquinone/menaquinone biosynthesis C-methylase UbiE